MPKSIVIDPAEQRRRGEITGPAIPVNAYVPDPEAEARQYGSPTLVRMFHDMALIREFETALDLLKREGKYKGIAYLHGGPAHLSIGQEAAAVGQVFHLTPDDFILGSHRSHGEIPPRLSAIEKLSDAELTHIMESYNGGRTLHAVETLAASGDVKDLAIDYLVYGTLAEIFGRATGFNQGMGGSMHAFFPPFGVMPNNAIVGGSADIALGMALFKRINRKPGIVIANIGDSAIGCGPVWEAIQFAAMDQYHTLWDNELGGAPPILFNFVNNFYGMGGQPYGETMGFGMLGRVGLGVNPEAMHAERVDGYNPLAVADAVERKKRILLEGRGPVLLDTITYRFSGHSTSDASSYRERGEIDLWRAQDSLIWYAEYLKEHGHADEPQLEAIRTGIAERLHRNVQAATSLEASPRVEPEHIGQLMFSNRCTDRMAEGEPDVLLPLEETRLKVTREKGRFGLDENGKPLPKLKALSYAEALFEAIIHRFYEDPTMVAFGEENRDWGGAFGVYRGLTEALLPSAVQHADRRRQWPAVIRPGGGRRELMYCDFSTRRDEIFNQMAKWQAMSANVLPMPLVLRVSVGSKYGAQHSQDGLP
jgi:2-oxoisovalerate dehydrogenase E1 component